MANTPTRYSFNPLSGNFDQVLQDPAQVITVAKSGAMFTTITDALNSITDATVNKQYVILVHPGTYVESITLKSYVGICGVSVGTGNTVITSSTTVVSGTVADDATHYLAHIGVVLTPTTDGQRCVDVTGNFGMLDSFAVVQTASNVETGSIRITSNSFCALSSTSQQYINTFVGLTKDYTCLELAGSGIVFLSVSSQRNSVNATAGVHTMFKLTGTNEFLATVTEVVYDNAAATGTCAVLGCSVTNATTKNRVFEYSDWRFVGAGGGSATAFYMDNATAEFFYSGMTISINGFATEYVANNVTAGGTQKIWLNSSNKNLGKTGAGLSIITPYDEVRTGFGEWSTAAGNFWSATLSTGTFSTLKRFTGIVKSAPVIAPAATLTGVTALTDLAVNYVYADSTGALKSTTSSTADTYESNIPVFQVWRDGANGLVCRENHPVKFTTAVSLAWHDCFGSLLKSPSSSLGVGLAGAKCAFTGENTILDHGITSAVAEAAAGFTATFLYVDGSGKMRQYGSATDVFPAYYNNAGTPTILTVGSNRWVIYRIGVIKDSGLTSSATAQFVAVMDTVQNTSAANATTRITSGAVTPFPPELKALEVCQVGYVVVRKTSAGAIDTTNVPPTTSLQIFGAQYVSGGTSTAAALITANTTDFDGEFSGAETNVQLCLDRIDDYDSLLDWATTKTYRVGNTVRVTTAGFIGTWRCVVAHTSAAAFSTDVNSGNWEIVSNSEGSRELVTQAGHGFAIKDVVYHTGSAYAKAQADTAAKAEVIGVVLGTTTDKFVLAKTGKITVTGLTAGQYFLSDATAGLATQTEPTTIGSISKPLFCAVSTTEAQINIMRGVTVGGVNATTSVSIASGTGPFTVQDLSAYTGGRIEGDVILAATTPLKGHYNIEFVKNGAANDYNISVTYTGDNPATFTITAAGLLRVTIGSPAGYSSCVFNYQLNGPAVGATFPLSISAGLVLGRTDGAAVPAGYIGEIKESVRSSALNLPVASSNVYGDIDPGVSTWSDANATGLALTPGVWDLQGIVDLVAGATAPTTVDFFDMFIGTAKQTSTTGIDPLRNRIVTRIVEDKTTGQSYATYVTPTFRVNISAGTTYYLKFRAIFSGAGSSIDCTGNLIGRRIA